MSADSSDNGHHRSRQHPDAIRGMDEGAYSAFFQHAPVAMAMIDPVSMRLLAVNEMAVKLFGYTHDEFAGKSPADLTRAGDVVITQQNMQAFLRDFRTPGVVEKCYVRKDGSMFWAQTAIALLKGMRGMGDVLIGTLVDITDRKDAERDLRRKVQELEQLMDVVPAAVWITRDTACRVITGNALANRLAEAVAQENVSATTLPSGTRSMRGPDGRELAPRELPMQVAAATNREVRDAVVQMTSPSGNQVTILGNAVPLRDEHGHAVGAIGAFQDISERTKAEQARRAQEMDRARWEKMESTRQLQVASVTAGLFAHEVSQPLGAIVCYLDTVLLTAQGSGLGQELRAQLEKCKAEALRAGDTIRELIGALRSGDTGGESIDIAQEIRDAVEIVRAIDLAPPAFQLRLEDCLPPGWAKRVDVQQVLRNLLLNRIDALRQAQVSAPEVTIVAAREGAEATVCVTVEDNGPGVDRKASEQMFKPFNTTTGSGIGGGLSFARSLMEANGGQLWHDPAEAQGAVFHLTIPVTGS